MKLLLHNFRCYSDAEFDIPDSGIILLSGNSGSGKSTLLKAILYALFGNKAVKKPYSFGTTTCSVTLTWSGLTITRSNRPNRLVVNDLEDDAGQSFIESRIGMGYDEFLISSYIAQKNNNSVLSLSQTDQVRMIKTIALGGDKCERYRESLNEMIRLSSDELISVKAELQFAENELDRLSDGLEPVTFPLPRVDGLTTDEIIADYRLRMQGYNTRIQILLEQKSTLADKIKELTIAKKQLQRLSDRRAQLELLISEIPTDIREEIDMLRIIIQYCDQRKQYAQVYEAEKTARDELRSNLTAKLVDFNEKATHKDIADMREQLGLWNIYKQATSRIAKIGANSEQLLIDIKEYDAKLSILYYDYERAKLQKELVMCPKCMTTLRWTNSELICAEECEIVDNCDPVSIKSVIEDVERSRDTAAQTLQKLREIFIPDIKIHNPQYYNDLEQRIKKTEVYFADCNQAMVQLNQLSDKPSPALNKLKTNIDKLSAQLDVIPDDDENIEELHQEMINKSAKLAEYELYQKELAKIICDIKKSKCKSSGNVDKMQKELKSVNDKIDAEKIQYEKDAQLYSTIDDYIAYSKRKEEHDHWSGRVMEISKALSSAEIRHSSHLTLKEKYNRAEIMALDSTINSINEHTRHYLETFFTEHLITAALEPANKGKIQTLKVNTIINYKGYEYDNVNQLSGGEFDRCTLASICGINSMLGSPILMLDESLASLDADTNTEILNCLKELAEDKLILVCSHEAVRGIFDDTVYV